MAINWEAAADGSHTAELVQLEGMLLAQVHEATRDLGVIQTHGQLFSAILPRRETANSATRPAVLIQPGSWVHATGVLFMSRGDKDHPQPFEVYMRYPEDLAVVARPSWFTAEHLAMISASAFILLLGSVAWGWTLGRKVRMQTRSIAQKISAEAALERRRSKILESTNASMPLQDILREITTLVSEQLGSALCWCQTEDGNATGTTSEFLLQDTLLAERIVGRSGMVLGTINVQLNPSSVLQTSNLGILRAGTNLAALAIETGKLYSDLRHRSEFDLLTDAHNRFSFRKRLDELIHERHLSNGTFGVIYIDLDGFKQINDQYGHGVGDLYLQEAAMRMKRTLRHEDVFARLGGDEFAVLIPGAVTPDDLEYIANRLHHVFDSPFSLPGCDLIHGSVSVGSALYPQDGRSSDDIVSTADQAMYDEKNARKRRRSGNADEIEIRVTSSCFSEPRSA